MFYTGKVHWYSEFTEKDVDSGFFLVADNYTEAVEQVCRYYGDHEIYNLSIEALAPDNILVTEDMQLYEELKDKIAEDTLW